jgi:hypothetical protein
LGLSETMAIPGVTSDCRARRKQNPRPAGVGDSAEHGRVRASVLSVAAFAALRGKSADVGAGLAGTDIFVCAFALRRRRSSLAWAPPGGWMPGGGRAGFGGRCVSPLAR